MLHLVSMLLSIDKFELVKMDNRFRFAIEEYAYPATRLQPSNYHILGNQWLMPSPYNSPIHAYAGEKNETDGLFQRFLHQNCKKINIGDFENFLVKNQHFFDLFNKNSPFSGHHFDGKVMVIR